MILAGRIRKFYFFRLNINIPMKSILYGLVAVVMIAFSSCKKEITELPPPTQTGANTFGAKVDDKLWGPASFGAISGAPILEAWYRGTDVVINARNFSSSPKETEFEIYIKNLDGPGVYPLNTNTQIYPNEAA